VFQVARFGEQEQRYALCLHLQNHYNNHCYKNILRTRKVKQTEWNQNSFYKYFCSNGCYNDFANANIERIVALAPRTEPLETPIDDPKKTKHETHYGHTYYDTVIKERVDNTAE
jgi:hypothetical protein